MIIELFSLHNKVVATGKEIGIWNAGNRKGYISNYNNKEKD